MLHDQTSYVVTVTVFGNLWGKKYRRYSWESICPPARHISAQKTVSVTVEKTLTHWVFVMKINHCDSQPSWPRLQWTLPPENSLRLLSEGVRLTGGHQGNILKKHRRHHVVYHHTSLGSVNSWQFVYKVELLRSENHHRRRFGEPQLRLLCIFSCVNEATDLYGEATTANAVILSILSLQFMLTLIVLKNASAKQVNDHFQYFLFFLSACHFWYFSPQ